MPDNNYFVKTLDLRKDNLFRRYRKKPEKNNRVPKIIFFSVLSIFLCVIIFFSCCIFLALKDENMDKFGTSPDNELSMNIAKTALYGREQTITNEQLNGQIAYLLQNRTKKDDSDFHLISCAVNFYKSKKSMMYIQALYKGAKLSINSNIDIVLDEKAEKLRIQLSKCSVGLLPIPAKMITDGIKESDDYKQKLHEYINVTDNEIILPSSYAVDDKKSDVKINIKMTKITENDGSVTIQVNSLLNNLEDIFSKFFKK